MIFQFSFDNKNELIIANGQPYINNNGALLLSIVDIDWEAFLSQVMSWVDKEIPAVCWDKQVDTILETVKCHQVLRSYVIDAVYKDKLIETLKTMSAIKRELVSILEMLIDEERNTYTVRLFEHVHSLENRDVQVFKTGPEQVRKLTRMEQISIQKELFEGMRVRYKTEDLSALVFREIRFLCEHQFIIRKCSHCRGFFWTRTTNKVYCNRIVPGRHATCTQYGPRRKRQIQKRPAYNLYWLHRTEAFHHASRHEDRHAFQAWIKAAQPYKSLARRGEISPEDMSVAMQQIEKLIFPTASLQAQGMEG